jgi:hypothetical protein
MERREYFVAPNFEPGYGIDVDKDAWGNGLQYQDEDEDSAIIHFDKDNPTIYEGIVFASVEDCRYLLLLS